MEESMPSEETVDPRDVAMAILKKRQAEISGVSEYKLSFKMKNKKEAVYHLSMHLIETYHVKTIKGTKRELFVYEDGIYIPGEDKIREQIRFYLQEICTTQTVKEVLETIKDLSPIDRKAFTPNKNLLNLNNGILNVRTKEFKEHSPDNLFMTKLPVDYNPKAECPVIKKFLSDVLDDEQITIVQEWTGYCLYPEYFIKKAIIFVGEGDTGKSTLMNLETTFFGPNNVSGVSLQKLSSDKFACAHLYNKNVNIYDDLSFKDIKENGMFKIATGGGVMTGEKKFGDQFQFFNYAKLTFACNKIPDVKDADDDAYFNRWIVIHFNYSIDEKERDKQLIHKMTTPEELSGFLNFALVGLDRLFENEKFSYNKNSQEIKEEMLQSGSSIAKFAFNCLEPCGDGWISKENMYQAFLQYTRQNNLPNASIKSLGQRLSKCATYIAQQKPTDKQKDSQVTAWSNVRLKDSFKFIPPTKEEDEIREDYGDIIDIIDDSNSYET